MGSDAGSQTQDELADGGAPAAAAPAMFDLTDGGVGVMPDPDDNPDQHVLPHHDAGIQISYEVVNVGSAAGQARVGVEVDDQFALEWQSRHLGPGESAVERSSLGRLSAGPHTILIYVNPGSGDQGHDHQTNEFNVE